ncbi:radical SAM/SPASM domain-containing protein [Miniphocaeibacter massiliensis]|uniref:radical SAM/SPASM domain-containing protein n=1 Tax=Miniphocaeibacter massiliensis TaxID=2041841 RepID=UPI000C1BF5D7|nr:radical SAM protein [Miniphocaeibacter massiliensis]
MILEKFGFITEKDSSIIFDKNSIEFYSISESDKDLLIKFNNNENLTYEELEKIKEILPEKESIEHKNVNVYSNIENLKIIISKKCNLSCKYCYEGNIDSESDGLMSKEQAIKIAERINRLFPRLKTVLFFGGEPLLNIDAIEVFCENLKNKKDIEFLMQTNGTIYTEKIKNIIENNNILVTVSLDGPKEINDANRVFPNDKGSYEIVVDNVKKFNKDRENIISIQSTYTKHAEKICSREEIKSFINNELGIIHIHLEDNLFEKLNKDNSKLSFDVLMEQLEIEDYVSLGEYGRILKSIVSKTVNEKFCTAGYKQLTIDPRGDIWPCPMYMSIDDNYGNVFLENIEQKLEDFYNYNEKQNREECKNCIANFWCIKCIGKYSINTENTPYDNCKENINKTEEVVTWLSKIIEKGEYNNFLDYYKKYNIEDI